MAKVDAAVASGRASGGNNAGGMKFLPGIAAGAAALLAEGGRAGGSGVALRTADLASCVDAIAEIFDHMGPVLHFARADMTSKVESLRSVAPQRPTLADVVESDKAAGTLTTRGSPARNLHRLAAVITFMRVLLEQLLADRNAQLKDVAYRAYEQSLAHIHPYVVRTAVWAGVWVVPARDAFLRSIGETEDSAAGPARAFVRDAAAIEAAVLSLFEGTAMPASDAAPAGFGGVGAGAGTGGSWSSWWPGTPQQANTS